MRVGTLAIALGLVLLFAGAVTAVVLVLLPDGDGSTMAIAPVGNGGAALTTSSEPSAVTDELIAFYQARVERDPVDFIAYTKLGESYVRQARETADISAYERAEAALRKALELRPDHLDAQASLANVLLAKHDFAGALALAEEVFAADLGATAALATIGDAQLELGNYDGARAAYSELADAASGPAVLSRLAHLAELEGDPDAAIAHMADAEQRASARARSAESVAWYRSQLGALYFNTGRYDEAGRWYAGALDAFPGYPLALAGLGDVAAARGDDSEAISWYERAVAVVPQPAFLATLGDLYARSGDAEAARRQYDTVKFIGELTAINGVVYNRALALFYADHGMNTHKAVELALAELEVRKDIYGYDAAAWALYKDGRANEAAPLMEQALKLGTQDARLLFHAAMIARTMGDTDTARAQLEHALEINPHFSVLHEDEARRALAALGGDDAFAEAGG